MNDAIFSDSFYFVPYRSQKNYLINRLGGAFRHYINYIVRGHCTLTAADTVLELGPGDLYYIPMGLRYQAEWKGKNILVHSLGFQFFPEADGFSFCLQKLPDSFAQEVLAIPLQIRPDSEAVSKLYALLARLVPVMLAAQSSTESPLMQKMKAYLYKYCRTPIPEVAKHCGVSPSTLYAACRKQLGKTPNQVRQELMIEKAVLLLESSNMTVQAISDELGFSSPVYFRKILKQYTGQTPRQLRKSHKQE